MWNSPPFSGRDIERLITHVVSPYVDDSSPMLHLDELCAECRYKLARIISAGKMQLCPTRAKFFGYLKVSFLNHVHTQIQKHVFSQKRAGIKASQKRSLEDSGRTKPLHLSLDDEDLGLQIASNDDSRLWSELIEHLEAELLPQEQAVIQHLKAVELPYPQARPFLEPDAAGSVLKRPGWKLQHYVAELGITVEEFARIMWRIRSKCRALVARG